MTVQSDLQKSIASCEAAKDSYSMMEQPTEEPQAKQMFNGMKSDIYRHLQFLNDRLSYLNQNNQLNE
ncbi:DUF1657 domain-containing protein [Clostridium botulinum]|uniref:DUF1657 domain-containing protein n=2 Tax=Clostridium botulinum TaxID=1491 RepID=A0A846HZ64_CLOBO|nr:conserved hypothetical protein [Clostridium botulinum Ba4 str. 657]AJE10708.1 hypothetical protein T259_2337 [Clostridium botulinum CDC_1436]AXG90736.1 DUF1657 domain-containing protein [Clostridium botulinum]EDT85032.1 flagellin protein [Clostridium botulinum Bf]MBY6879428.1 DUF1657 domain-containing protein [Clostridium botulinum]